MNEKGPRYYPLDEFELNRINIFLNTTPRRIDFEVGRKWLRVELGIYSDTFATRLNSSDYSERIENETTIVYSKALMFMQCVVDLLGRPFKYNLVTKDKKMEEWAKDPAKGRRVFNWEKDGYDDGRFVATKTIVPTTS